jgi:hypothetical protein
MPCSAAHGRSRQEHAPTAPSELGHRHTSVHVASSAQWHPSGLADVSSEKISGAGHGSSSSDLRCFAWALTSEPTRMAAKSCITNSQHSPATVCLFVLGCCEGVYIQQGRKRTSEHHPRGKGGGGGPPPAKKTIPSETLSNPPEPTTEYWSNRTSGGWRAGGPGVVAAETRRRARTRDPD